jgi:hypothetical protein
LEAVEALVVVRDRFREDFDRNVAVQMGSEVPIDLAHAAGAK